jgi:hypothetical protein
MAKKKLEINSVKYASATPTLVDYDEDMKIGKSSKAMLFVFKALTGEFPQVAELQDGNGYYLPESEVVRVAKELGLFE